MILATIRYVCVCYDSSHRLNRYLKTRPGLTLVIILSLLILIPAIIWPVVMYYGSNVTGRAYHLKYSHLNSMIVAFQNVGDNRKDKRSIFRIVLICFYILQFVSTILLYLKILYTAYMSTTRVAVRNAVGKDTIGITDGETNARGHVKGARGGTRTKNQNEVRLDYISKHNTNKTADIEMNNWANEEIISDNNVAQNVTVARKTAGKGTLSIAEKRNAIRIVNKKHDQSLEFVNSKGEKKIVQPKLGDRVINIPLTDTVLCISRTDVICTIGLSCQLLSLITTFILLIFGFRISGKIVTMNEFFAAYYCMEIALLVNSVIDPIVSVIFSTNFRDALKCLIRSHREQK